MAFKTCEIPEGRKLGYGYNIEYAQIASRLAAAGFTLKNIAYALGVSKSKLSTWRKKFPDFDEALKNGKEVAKKYLISKALLVAGGYEYVEKNITLKEDKFGDLKKTINETHKQQKPDPQLLMFMLCNMCPEEFKSKHKLEIDENKNITVKLDAATIANDIRKLAGKLYQSKQLEDGSGKKERKQIKSRIIQEAEIAK